MSDFVERLAGCGEITEWVGLFDERLAVASGVPSPDAHRGQALRENWHKDTPGDRVVAEISRLIVPKHVVLSEPPKVELTADEWRGQTRRRVLLHFATESDWLQCFPLGDAAKLPQSDEDWRGWAAVALCGNKLGLAVFAQLAFTVTDSTVKVSGVEARVQPVPEAAFQKLVG